MEFNENLFDNNLTFLSELYQQKANEINKLEQEFREIKRKELYPNWRIFRRCKRKWITFAGIFELNLTMYEITDQITKKVKRFCYYHHSKLEELQYSKYDIDVLKYAVRSYLENTNTPLFLKEFLPSKQLINHYIKTSNIEEIIYENNQKLLTKTHQKLVDCNEQIYLEMDDFYVNHQQENLKKMRVREVILHTLDDKKRQLNDVINIFFTKNLDERNNEFNNLNYVFWNIKHFIKSFKNRWKIIVNGDAAKWISNLAEQLELKFCLDLFHIKKALNTAFSTNKFASQANKKYFKNWINKQFNLPWKDVFEQAIFNKDKEFFKQIYFEFLAEARRNNVPSSIILNARSFYKMIMNNSKWLFENHKKFSSFTEHFVFNSFKKHIKKWQALFCFRNIKMKVIFKNLLKNQATVFL
ncbi:Mbov_0401 family ICE element transposase-like protein [Mycoplasma yeatsii]|uniref:Mbov_0401 family ICE element transposase-like protein n=1 Tax=Mycoplasma yeatsii TaxID=51365 RepID=UPI0005B23FFE|nr:integrative conjugal element protein [Mycoplasma yeatsii]AJM71569.1 hypothetical protein MYE_00355 [Mycoplasma yeatsii GM274B]